MADVDRLKAIILEDARQQEKLNMEQAEKKASEILQKAREEALQKKDAILEKARKDASERKKRLIAYALLEARKQKLEAKREMVKEAFEKAICTLNSLPVEQYENLLVDMVVRSVKTGDEEVILSARDKTRIGEALIKKVNEKLAASGKQGRVKLSEKVRDFAGGFILVSGNIEINNSFEMMIRTRREELETEVLKVLFD